jgi:hypothetical protein
MKVKVYYMNILKKFRAKQEEKKDIENFLCQLGQEPSQSFCRRVPFLKWLFKAFLSDQKENRILQIDEDYSMTDWVRERNQSKEWTNYVMSKNNNNGTDNHNDSPTGEHQNAGRDPG